MPFWHDDEGMRTAPIPIIRFIRERYFHATQESFAALLGVHQATVAKWERSTFSPDIDLLRRIRSAAHGAGLHWQDDVVWAYAMGDGSVSPQVWITPRIHLDEP